MDDTTIASYGCDWIPTAQEGFLLFEKVGIVVDQHKCCIFFPSECLTEHATVDNALAGCASWKAAALLALTAYPRQQNFRALGSPVPLTRKDLMLIGSTDPEANRLVAKLVALPCKCKAKTTIVPSLQLTCDQVQLLDSTPFGAKVVKDQDVTLGLPLASSFHEVLPLNHDGTPTSKRRRRLKAVADKHFDKISHKLHNRAHKLVSTRTSGPYRALYWTTYCQSMLYYFASCFELSNTRLRKLLRLQQKVIIGRPWIQGAHLADVFSAFKIGPCCNLLSALRRAKVSLCLRIYGLQGILSAKDSHPILGTAKRTLPPWTA
jgi:hypothetical protein